MYMHTLFGLICFVAIAGAATVSTTVDLSDPAKWNCGEDSYDYYSYYSDTFPIGSITVPVSTNSGTVKMEAVFDNSDNGEYLQLICEGIDFGEFDDPYYSPGSSWVMSQYAYNDDCDLEIGTAHISAAAMAALTADGKIDCTLTASADVDFCCKYGQYPNNPDLAKITFSIDSSNVPLFPLKYNMNC